MRLVNNGVILPNSQELKFNFEAVNLKAVDLRVIKIFEDNILQFLQDNELSSSNENSIRQVGRRIVKKTILLTSEAAQDNEQWKTYSVDLSSLFKADQGAIYRVEVEFKKEYALYDCSVNRNITNTENNDDYYHDDYYYDENTTSTTEDEALREEAYWDNVTYRYRNNNYNWRERDNPCHEAYYNSDRMVSQNLMASNLGVLVKKGTTSDYYFAVTNLLNTNVEAQALVKIYNYQQQEIASAKTNAEGLATIRSDKRAAFAIISKDNSHTYIKLGDGNSLSLSKFDVSRKSITTRP
uniref:hypothetical protein n=1 Tax=Lacinutrix neustonica TaxID=2980107 RepID=UPI0028BED3BB|nr:hypothetical protein [Lacinutrix neustonica]